MLGSRLLPLAGLALVALAPSALEARQKAPPTPAEVEKTVRKKAEGWLRDRTAERLGCKTCLGSGQEEDGKRGKMACTVCRGSLVSSVRVEEAFWRVMDPEWRKRNNKAEYMAWLQPQGRRLTWRECPGVVSAEAKIDRVVVCRDVAWTWTSKEAAYPQPRPEGWIRRGSAYYLCPRVEIDPMESVEACVDHPWFVLGTLSVAALHREAMRLRAPELEAGLTDMERDRRAADRASRESSGLTGRVVSDMGVITDVESRGDSYLVTLACGLWTVSMSVGAPEDEAARAALEQTLSRRERQIVFRGKARTLSRQPAPRRPPERQPRPRRGEDETPALPLAGREGEEPDTLSSVSLDDGEVLTLDAAAPR